MTATAGSQSKSSSAHLYPPKTAVQAAADLIAKARVPHIPEVVQALREELRRPEPDLRTAADLIAKDPAITGDLLKAVNSTAFNLSTRITSIQQAAGLMGLQRLTHYVTAVALKRVIDGLDPRVQGVWEDIMTEVQAMVAVARVTSVVSAEEAYLFGVMHDIGALLFASLSGDYISQWVLRSCSEPSLLTEYELGSMGVDHGTIGFMVAASWKMSEYFALGICHHHAPGYLEGADVRTNRLIALGKAAHYLVGVSRGTHALGEMESYLDEVFQGLEIDADQWQALCSVAESGGWGASG